MLPLVINQRNKQVILSSSIKSDGKVLASGIFLSDFYVIDRTKMAIMDSAAVPVSRQAGHNSQGAIFDVDSQKRFQHQTIHPGG